MQSYDVGPTTPPILEETIGANFERTVASNPDAEALVDVAANRRWTYGQLNSAIDLIARALISLGIAKGERVAIWAPNCAQWTIVQYATAKIGAILVNINPAYRTHELAYALNQSGVRTLIGLTNFKTSNYRSMICEVSPGCPELKDIVFLDNDDWDALRDRGISVPDRELKTRSAALANTDPINIQYTSGTTGFPKGATLSHRNILNNGFFATELLNLGPDDRLCIPVPFYHCFGMVLGNLGCTTHGATMVIPATNKASGYCRRARRKVSPGGNDSAVGPLSTQLASSQGENQGSSPTIEEVDLRRHRQHHRRDRPLRRDTIHGGSGRDLVTLACHWRSSRRAWKGHGYGARRIHDERRSARRRDDSPIGPPSSECS
ncbi:acyl-CoA synthetase [Mycobacterium xenopi]|uniref:AMP-dependent synthetase/ligase domain-containing protein n=1 Tax=Mycobacterium xenopi TaxID=1789 RepID=A0AAD1H7A7_MYCXE|nr:hypothetical protein MYXE_48240 [Mycobacterium xenopi]SPX89691.1 acyl-CoA synthetase [Mycobacterium xenopi]